MIKTLFLLAWLPALVFAFDDVALISDDATRARVLKKQVQEIYKRASSDATDCAELLAPLEGPAGPMDFEEATTALEKTVKNIALRYPANCINSLLQNLALLAPATPASRRIISALNPYEPIVQGFHEKALACEVHQSGIETLLALAQNAQAINECTPLQMNKWKRVSGTSAYGTSINYSLNKSAAGIRVAINIDFKQAAAPSEPADKTVSNETMLARARGCMEAVGGIIKGPTGEPMKFDLITPAEAARMPSAVRPRANNVTIDHAVDVRSNSGNYAHDVGCPTIVHEVLHLVGLCDEYPGESDGKLCRAVPKQNNVMGDTFEAFNASVPRRVTCECTSEACAAAIAQPGRIMFLKAPRFTDRTTARFRNAFCTTPTSTTSVTWPATDTAPPRQPYAATLDTSGLKLTMTDYYLNTEDWQSIFGNTTECTCPESDTRCRETLAQIAAGQMKANTRECQFGMKSGGVSWGETNLGDVVSGNKFSFDVNPGSTPFVHPKHIQRIMGGTCPSIASSYNNCAKNAYADSPQECEDAPAYCMQSDFHEQP
jgi:hypothetical protein